MGLSLGKIRFDNPYYQTIIKDLAECQADFNHHHQYWHYLAIESLLCEASIVKPILQRN